MWFRVQSNRLKGISGNRVGKEGFKDFKLHKVYRALGTLNPKP